MSPRRLRRPPTALRALTAVLAAGLAFVSLPDALAAPPQVDPVLGARLRLDRPFAVRVAGGADRVRAPQGPWAAPRGAQLDEFVIPAQRGAGEALRLEVERGGEVAEVTLRLEPVPRDERLVFGFDADRAPAGAVILDPDTLPTVREAWYQADEVVGDPARAEEPARLALQSWRAGPRPGDGARGSFVPLLHEPGSGVFAATERVAAAAPRLRADVRTVATGLAGLVIVLVVLVTWSRRGTGGENGRPLAAREGKAWGRAAWGRAVWVAAPALLAAGWLLAAGRLPREVLATAIVLEGPRDRLVVIRLSARAAADVRLTLPPDACGAALFAYDAEDASIRSAAVGRVVALGIGPGEYRVLGYHAPAPADDGSAPSSPSSPSSLSSLSSARTPGAPGAPAGPRDRALVRWIESLGLAPSGREPRRVPVPLPQAPGIGPPVVRSIGVVDGN